MQLSSMEFWYNCPAKADTTLQRHILHNIVACLRHVLVVVLVVLRQVQRALFVLTKFR